MRKLILLENVTEKQYSPLGEVVDKGILGWCFLTITSSSGTTLDFLDCLDFLGTSEP